MVEIGRQAMPPKVLLLVEDRDFASLLGDFLTRQGFRVLAPQDRAQARTLARGGAVDAAIAECDLGGENRRILEGTHVPVLGLLGLGEPPHPLPPWCRKALMRPVALKVIASELRQLVAHAGAA